MMQYL